MFMIILQLNYICLQVSLWDTAGSERFRTLTNNFYRNADGVLLVFCVEDSYTFDNLQGWITDASQHLIIDKCEWALIGNKSDLQNEVEKKRIESLLKQLNIKLFYYVSAKTGENVMHAFNTLITTIHEKRVKHSSGPPAPKNTVIDSAVKIEATTTTVGDKQKTSGCCNQNLVKIIIIFIFNVCCFYSPMPFYYNK